MSPENIEDIERELEDELADLDFDDGLNDPASMIEREQEMARKAAEEARREAEKLTGKT